MPAKPFYGRERELATFMDELRAVTSSGSGRLIALRGRRQVGKSRLLEHFAAKSGVAYGTIAGMKGAPVEVQMRRAVEALSSAEHPLPGLDALTAVRPADWHDLLSRVRLALQGSPAILVLDEFPWAVETSPGLDGLMQALWDQELANHPVLIVLVGSDEAMMQRLFEHDRPLFGRLDGNLVLAPFNPAETAQALGGAAQATETFDAQLITGGFPELVARARQFHSARAMVQDALARPHSALADIAQINLAGELSEQAGARAVLEAIGADEIGVMSFSRIASVLGGGSAAHTAVSRAAQTLADKRIVAVDLPAGSSGGRLKRYRIADSYLRFWFAFIEPQLRNVEVGRSDLALRSFRESWPSWRGKAIEPLVREAVIRLAPSLPSPYDTIEAVGGWWDRTGRHEFDLVGLDRTGAAVLVGEVKWRERSSFTRQDLSALATARSVIPRAAQAGLLAVTPRGGGRQAQADLALSASDLLTAWAA